MEKQSLREPEETLQETLLRATLQQHAPSTIDLEQSWEKIVPALRTPRKQVSFPQTSLFFLANAFWQQQGEKRSLRHPRILVAAIAVLIVLIGVGVTFPITSRLGGNQVAHAYTQVNQTQQDQNIKVTLLNAYASYSGTSLVTTVQIGNERGHLVVPSGTLRYQEENLGISSGSVFVAHVSHPNLSCQFYNYLAAHPPVDAQTVTLIWHVDQINIGQFPLAHNPGQIIYGNWTFQFTIPFHHDNFSPDPSVNSPLC
ncbi:MAG TPA: DUF4179 domain-containing protein [Ktedonobacteraceae bacterium]|jgi:hypothetical protein